MKLGRRALLAGAAGLWCAGRARPARAHPYHVSLAEAHHRSERGRLEVSLRMTPEDLDAELGRRLGRAVELGAAPFDAASESDRELGRVLRDGFVLEGQDGLRYGVHLVGREIEIDYAWVYFELAAPPKLDGLTLWVGLLFELEPRMENTVNLITEAGRRSFSFRRADPPAPL